jgi:hypothetical protein
MSDYPNYADQSESEGNFYWLTGPLAGIKVSTGNNSSMTQQAGVYNNWAIGQPDNNGIYGNASYFNVSNGKWYDESFYDNSLNYIYKNLVIEYGGMMGDPAVNTIFTKTMSNMAVLPVTIISFDVKKENNTALVEWEIATEGNNSYFDIERSADNFHFLTTGKVTGRGNTNAPQQYRFFDYQPLSGINYYRLKQVDMNGNFSYSITKRLDFNNKKIVNQLYPSIATNTINVRLANADDVTCYIINSAGALVQQIKSPGTSFTIQVQSLAKGVYIFSIVSSKGEKDNLPFVKR